MSKHAPALPLNLAKGGEGMLKRGFCPNHVRDGKSQIWYCCDLGVSRGGNASGHAVPQSCPGMYVESQGWEFSRPELGVAVAKVVVFFLLFFSFTQPEYQVATEVSTKKETVYFQCSDPGYLKLCSSACSSIGDGKTPAPCITGFAASRTP